uniref:DUF1275 family protein n=1 Tax=Acinetobacter ursingii TaxID=108980 RepID=UPI00124CE1AB
MPFQSLPNWVQFAAFLLAMNAGMINVLSLITVLHQSISHMTGNVSIFSLSFFSFPFPPLLSLFFFLFFFFLFSFSLFFLLFPLPLHVGVCSLLSLLD